MTKHITVVAPSGKIVQRYEGNFDNNDIEALSANQGDNMIVATNEAVLDSYFDFETEKFVPMPSKPDFDAVFDYATKKYVRKETLDEAKEKIWQMAKNIRSHKEQSGFTYAGNAYDSDLTSQTRINSAAALGHDVLWLTKDNREISLSAAELIEFQKSLAQHIARIHQETQMLRQQIYAAETFDELDAVSQTVRGYRYN
ncbi:DUF4376 domain-containing protein [Acinetobacter baumannii]